MGWVSKQWQKAKNWAERNDPWMAIKNMKSEDWTQAGMVTAGIIAGALTGGLGGAAIYGAATAAVPLGIVGGATVGGLIGESSAVQYHEEVEAEKAGKRAEATQRAENLAAEIQSKQSLLAAHQSMTAREAMARNINAAIRGMYSAKVKSGSDPVEAEDLGGGDEKLG